MNGSKRSGTLPLPSALSAGESAPTNSVGVSTAAGTPPLSEVSDKRGRYYIEMDPKQSLIVGGKTHRLAACLTKRDAPNEQVWIILYNLHTQFPDWRYEGPQWKKHHADLYRCAVVAEMDALGTLPEIGCAPARDATLPLPVPLPPLAPPCPKCGTRLQYKAARIGGRGLCWRHICPKRESVDDLDPNPPCTYYERWKS